jgi:hypothetical protein
MDMPSSLFFSACVSREFTKQTLPSRTSSNQRLRDKKQQKLTDFVLDQLLDALLQACVSRNSFVDGRTFPKKIPEEEEQGVRTVIHTDVKGDLDAAFFLLLLTRLDVLQKGLCV